MNCKTKINLINYGNLYNNESSDQVCTHITPKVSFSIFPVFVPLVGSCKCSLNRLGSLTGGQNHHPHTTVVCHLSSHAHISNWQESQGYNPPEVWIWLAFSEVALELLSTFFFCMLSTSGRANDSSAQESKARTFALTLPFLAGDWTLVRFPMGGSVVALRYEKELVCFPKSTPLSQKKSLATNLHVCLQKKNLVLPVL